MKQLESPADWLEARKLKTRGASSERPEDVFEGVASLDRADIQGVRVSRLRVAPAGEAAPPVSYAVTDPAEGPDPVIDRAAGLDWKKVKGSEQQDLPMELVWQQSAESRWDFYFKLPRGAYCFGLGERLSGLNLRGRAHTLFNHSDPVHVPSLDPMYKSIPLLIVAHHGRYQGFFLDSPARQRWSLDAELDGEGSIELLSRRGFTLYAFDECSLPDLLAAFTSLTGRTKLPPNWALGHQQSRWSYPDEKTVREVARQFRERKIPCDTMVLDIDYMDEYRVFTNDPERFPDLGGLVADLADDDFNVVAIVDPGVKKEARFGVYQDGMKRDFFVKKGDGKPFVGKVWPGQCVFPDFLRHDVRVWWAAMQGFFTDNGIKGVWNDMNEPQMIGQQDPPLPVDAVELPDPRHQMFVQQAPEGEVGHFEVRNLYGMLMSRAAHEGLTAMNPDERPFVLTRSCYAGIQKYAAVWLGDNMSWWEHLCLSVPMLVNMGLSGVPFGGVDIGGFGDDCSPELLVRWYEVGIFYPFFRNHSAMKTRLQEPFAFGPETEEHCRHLIETRYRLLPYIRNLFWEAYRNGAPLMRPLFWDYPGDENVYEIEDQFLFGRDILVAPVLRRGARRRTVYLPEGLWHPFEGGAPLPGGRLHTVNMELGRVPAFVRDGSIIPYSPVMQSTAEYESAPITFRCYGDRGIGLFTEDDGISLEYENEGYNEWLLTYEKGEFRSQLVNYGYIAPERQYLLEHENGVEAVVLEK